MDSKCLVAGILLACSPLVLFADPIDDLVNAHLQRTGTPGAAIAVVRDGLLFRAQGYGYANVEHKIPVHADTVFQSGSVGKMFTAAAAMLMVEDGKITLDAPICAVLPDAPASWSAITLRQLLSHTSGINRSPDFDLRKDYTEDELLQLFYKTKAVLDFPAGQRWSYSNTAYALVGILVHKVGGKPYSRVLKERVFEPLGMNTAGLIDDRGIVLNRAAGYEVGEGGDLLNQDWVAPTGNSTADGALYLTVLDFVKWDAAVRARKILRPESWEQVFMSARLNSGNTYPYGLGWFLRDHDGRRAHHHSGGWQGFSTRYVRYLDKDVSVVVLTNGTRSSTAKLVTGVASLVDPGLAPAPGVPVGDRDAELTNRVQRLLAGSKLSEAVLTAVESESERADVVRAYAERRKPLGAVKEVRPFRYEQMGDERIYVYRARFAKGIADLTLARSLNGGISGLELNAVDAWNSPLL